MKNQIINIVTSANKSYAIPLTVMIRSLLENIESDIEVNLYILHDDFDSNLKRTIENSWKPYIVHVTWILPDKREIERNFYLKSPEWVVAYFVLKIGQLLPNTIHKILFLDADLIIKSSICPLWEKKFTNNILFAVPDAKAERLKKTSSGDQPAWIPYFNSGVMLIDLTAWRKFRVEEKAFKIANKNSDSPFHDQQILNDLLDEAYLPLHPTWNVITSILQYPCHCLSPFPETVFREAVERPKIVHYTGWHSKPWILGTNHPYKSDFFYYLDQTAWAGWRPQKSILDFLNTRFNTLPSQKIRWYTSLLVACKRKNIPIAIVLFPFLKYAFFHPIPFITYCIKYINKKILK